jgi:hypothetical protein
LAAPCEWRSKIKNANTQRTEKNCHARLSDRGAYIFETRVRQTDGVEFCDRLAPTAIEVQQNESKIRAADQAAYIERDFYSWDAGANDREKLGHMNDQILATKISPASN